MYKLSRHVVSTYFPFLQSSGGQMKLTRSLLALAFNFSLILPSVFILQTTVVNAQTVNAALQRGYRTGYSDGYMAGYRDSIDSLDRSISRHREFETADRAYNKEYGPLEDYRDGYRQGFQAGYDTGFDKKSFESTVPANLSKKGLSATANAQPEQKNAEPAVAASEPPAVENKAADIPVPTTDSAMPSVQSSDPIVTSAPANDPPADKSVIQNTNYRPNDSVLTIPKDTEIIIELQNDVSTQTTRQGERFTGKVVSPMELDGAIVEGHVEKVQLPGRIKKPAELQLSFDRIVISDSRWANFSGVLSEVVAIKGDNVRRVSDEGTAVGQSSIKGDAIKVGASTGTGAGIGAITGGPVGLAVGASIGAAFGIGSALIDRGKHIRLNKNQQLKVRSAYDTQIR
jgi:hypothetical protein